MVSGFRGTGGNGFLDGPTVEGYFVFDPAHNRSQLVIDGARGYTIPGMEDWLGDFQREGGTYSDTNLKLLFDGQFSRMFNFLVSTRCCARSPSMPEWIKPPVSDCSQAFPNGSIAGNSATRVDAPPHESCATTPSRDCCESSEFPKVPDLLLGIPGSPTSGISKYGNSLLSAFLPDAEDELGSTLKDLGLSFSRRDTLGVMGSGVSMSMDRWTRRNDCRNVPNSPLLQYDNPNAGQAFFNRGTEIRIEPTYCQVVGAKAWTHRSSRGSNDPWQHGSDSSSWSGGDGGKRSRFCDRDASQRSRE